MRTVVVLFYVYLIHYNSVCSLSLRLMTSILDVGEDEKGKEVYVVKWKNLLGNP